MATNLTPQYRAADQQYRDATTDAERLVALMDMLRLVPKHKASEKLQADLKKKIAQLRSGGKKKGGGSHRAPSHSVERSGAAQIAIVGAPNCGKSRFVAQLTAAEPEVADYPFTTRVPTPGIARPGKIPLQLIDLPPVTAEHIEPWLVELVRNCDFLLVLLDLASDEILEEWEALLEALDRFHVSLSPEPPLEERQVGVVYHRHVLAGNKADDPEAGDRLEILRDLIGDRPVLLCSLETGEGIPEVMEKIVEELELIRVYTQVPGKKPDLEEPFVLRRGATVEDAARAIHKDLAKNLKFARAWAPRFHDGQRVAGDVELEDEDILEFHQ